MLLVTAATLVIQIHLYFLVWQNPKGIGTNCQCVKWVAALWNAGAPSTVPSAVASWKSRVHIWKRAHVCVQYLKLSGNFIGGSARFNSLCCYIKPLPSFNIAFWALRSLLTYLVVTPRQNIFVVGIKKLEAKQDKVSCLMWMQSDLTECCVPEVNMLTVTSDRQW